MFDLAYHTHFIFIGCHHFYPFFVFHFHGSQYNIRHKRQTRIIFVNPFGFVWFLIHRSCRVKVAVSCNSSYFLLFSLCCCCSVCFYLYLQCGVDTHIFCLLLSHTSFAIHPFAFLPFYIKDFCV